MFQEGICTWVYIFINTYIYKSIKSNQYHFIIQNTQQKDAGSTQGGREMAVIDQAGPTPETDKVS